MKKINSDFFLIILMSLLLNLSSCNFSVPYKDSDFYDFGSEGMASGVEYIFYPFKGCKELNQYQNIKLYLILRYQENTQINSLPIEIEWYVDSINIFENKNLSIPFFDQSDLKKGTGNFALYEMKNLLLNVENPNEDFFISIKTPELNTKGIVAMGLIWEK